MKVPKEISVQEFDYFLPPDRIARFPLDNRDMSKLLIYRSKEINQTTFSAIHEIIPAKSLLVFNNTKVVRARLHFKKITGAIIEVFILEPISPAEYTVSFATTSTCTWKCIVGNLKRWKDDPLEATIPDTNTKLIAQKVGVDGEGVIVNFKWENKELSFARIIELCGEVPIPPYLNREPVENDTKTYQTVYAFHEGSVAAPTAGLHFTPNLINKLSDQNIGNEYITLHVGAGTFKPVKANSILDHEMHTEHFFIDAQVISNIKNNLNRIFSVGTTTLRTLESIYWLGVKLKLNLLDVQQPFLGQWEPYTLNSDISPFESLELLENWLKKANISQLSAATQLCIVPGYQFKIVDTLITNYHQPRSTLLMLVAAFIGEDWKSVYKYALDNDFRFLSYGDSSILFRNSFD